MFGDVGRVASGKHHQRCDWGWGGAGWWCGKTTLTFKVLCVVSIDIDLNVLATPIHNGRAPAQLTV